MKKPIAENKPKTKTITIAADLYDILATDAKRCLRTPGAQLEALLEAYFEDEPASVKPAVETPAKTRKEAEAMVDYLQELVKKMLRKSEKTQAELLDYLTVLDERYVRSRRTKALLAVIIDILHEEVHREPRRKTSEVFEVKNNFVEDILNAEILEFAEPSELNVKCAECGKTEKGSREFLKREGWQLKEKPLCVRCDLL